MFFTSNKEDVKAKIRIKMKKSIYFADYLEGITIMVQYVEPVYKRPNDEKLIENLTIDNCSFIISRL
ncbi:hypothetical protein D0T60_02725 [Bacteroides sp. 224]|nr:hypothetical protein [Bacteroides sp. 224]